MSCSALTELDLSDSRVALPPLTLSQLILAAAQSSSSLQTLCFPDRHIANSDPSLCSNDAERACLQYALKTAQDKGLLLVKSQLFLGAYLGQDFAKRVISPAITRATGWRETQNEMEMDFWINAGVLWGMYQALYPAGGSPAEAGQADRYRPNKEPNDPAEPPEPEIGVPPGLGEREVEVEAGIARSIIPLIRQIAMFSKPVRNPLETARLARDQESDPPHNIYLTELREVEPRDLKYYNGMAALAELYVDQVWVNESSRDHAAVRCFSSSYSASNRSGPSRGNMRTQNVDNGRSNETESSAETSPASLCPVCPICPRILEQATRQGLVDASALKSRSASKTKYMYAHECEKSDTRVHTSVQNSKVMKTNLNKSNLNEVSISRHARQLNTRLLATATGNKVRQQKRERRAIAKANRKRKYPSMSS